MSDDLQADLERVARAMLNLGRAMETDRKNFTTSHEELERRVAALEAKNTLVLALLRVLIDLHPERRAAARDSLMRLIQDDPAHAHIAPAIEYLFAGAERAPH